MATATKFEEFDVDVSIIAVVAMLEAARLCQGITNHVLMLMPPLEHYRDLRAAVVAWAVQRNLDVRVSLDGVGVGVHDGGRTIVTVRRAVQPEPQVAS